jgi:23S rRNA (guanosine2251-2'-O)-methyltransferase
MNLTLVLNNIRSAWNVGAIMRTCDALGAKLILVGYTPKPLGQTLKLIQKTAIGAENTVQWQHYDNWRELLQEHNQAQAIHLGIEISENSKSLFDYLHQESESLKEKDVYLWLGNEIHGLESELVSQLNQELHLPMQGKKESINVASCACTVGYMFRFVTQKITLN